VKDSPSPKTNNTDTPSASSAVHLNEALWLLGESVSTENNYWEENQVIRKPERFDSECESSSRGRVPPYLGHLRDMTHYLTVRTGDVFPKSN